MKVSIIIPVYNVAPYIQRCIESVQAQTYKDIECLLIDDCSTDESITIVEKIISECKDSSCFSIIHHNTNQGLSAARNTGIIASTGEYIYFLDSDDSITSDCIELLVHLAVKYPEADYVQGNTVQGSNDLMKGKNADDIPEY